MSKQRNTNKMPVPDAAERVSKRSVLDTIVPNGLCVGCGMCAAIFPETLRMDVSREGAYLPIAISADTGGDDQAVRWNAKSLEVCPFADNVVNEDTIAQEQFSDHPGIAHRSELGYYLDCFRGWITDDEGRWNSTSGGIITWLVADLLDAGIIDAALCVGSTDEPGKFFEYQVIRTAVEARGTRKSRYWPVELSSVIQEIKKTGERVAVVGLPCFLKAIHLAMRVDPQIRAQVVCTVGLFCGHLKTRQFAKYLSRTCGIHETDAKSFDFRKKSASHPANAYAFEVSYHDGDEPKSRQVMMRDVFAGSWTYNLFMLDACDCCDDVTAETADVSVGDAWLPEYVGDNRGTSLIVCRDPALHGRLQAGAERGELDLQSITAEKVISSQVGGFRHRREGLAYRLHLARMRKRWRPRKRVAPDARALGLFYRLAQRLRLQIKRRSREAFARYESRADLRAFIRTLRPWIAAHNLLYAARRNYLRAGRFPGWLVRRLTGKTRKP